MQGVGDKELGEGDRNHDTSDGENERNQATSNGRKGVIFFAYIHYFFIIKNVFLWVRHNNDYTSIGYKHVNIMTNIVHFKLQDYIL